MDRYITADMTFAQAIELYPACLEVLQSHGLSCGECCVAPYDTIAQGARAHGLDLRALLVALNRAVALAQAER